MSDITTRSEPPFGPVHIIHPESTHTHTIVCLHGRGSNGPEFAEEFLASHLSDGEPITRKLPGARWVFPSSPETWSAVFQEPLSEWFEARSLTDITFRQDLQISGIKRSVAYLQKVLDDEISKLAGNPARVFLGGISQGGAVGLWTLLSQSQPLAGFFAASTWLPFAENMKRLASGGGKDLLTDTENKEQDAFVRGMLNPNPPSRQTRVFLGHGVDDAYIDVTLGRQARDTLSDMGFESVEWTEYTEAEEEGHWFKVPQQMDDISEFIQRMMQREEP